MERGRVGDGQEAVEQVGVAAIGSFLGGNDGFPDGPDLRFEVGDARAENGFDRLAAGVVVEHAEDYHIPDRRREPAAGAVEIRPNGMTLRSK